MELRFLFLSSTFWLRRRGTPDSCAFLRLLFLRFLRRSASLLLFLNASISIVKKVVYYWLSATLSGIFGICKVSLPLLIDNLLLLFLEEFGILDVLPELSQYHHHEFSLDLLSCLQVVHGVSVLVKQHLGAPGKQFKRKNFVRIHGKQPVNFVYPFAGRDTPLFLNLSNLELNLSHVFLVELLQEQRSFGFGCIH